MKRKTPEQLRGDARVIRYDCARMLMKAEEFEREAEKIEEQQAAQEEANRATAVMWFEWKRRLVRAH